MSSSSSARKEAALERVHTPQRQSSARPSHEIDETDAVSPKPSELSLRRTHSAPTKTSSTDGLSTGDLFPHRLSGPSRPQDIRSSEGLAFSAPKFGPVKYQKCREPLDDIKPMKVFVKNRTGKTLIFRYHTQYHYRGIFQTYSRQRWNARGSATLNLPGQTARFAQNSKGLRCEARFYFSHGFKYARV